jgi:hypothetical protein
MSASFSQIHYLEMAKSLCAKCTNRLQEISKSCSYPPLSPQRYYDVDERVLIRDVDDFMIEPLSILGALRDFNL